MTNTVSDELQIVYSELRRIAAIHLRRSVSHPTEEPRKASVVEMRFFGGLEFHEIAEQLKVSVITVKRDWQFCRAWLFKALTDGEAA